MKHTIEEEQLCQTCGVSEEEVGQKFSVVGLCDDCAEVEFSEGGW